MNRNGMYDLMFTSRRDKFDLCTYWLKDQENPNRAILEYLEYEPSGHFNAKVYSPEYNEKNVIAGSFMLDKETITIVSTDDLAELKENDIVEFRGDLYRVDYISKAQIRKNNEFLDDVEYSYSLTLKR